METRTPFCSGVKLSSHQTFIMSSMEVLIPRDGGFEGSKAARNQRLRRAVPINQLNPNRNSVTMDPEPEMEAVIPSQESPSPRTQYSSLRSCRPRRRPRTPVERVVREALEKLRKQVGDRSPG